MFGLIWFTIRLMLWTVAASFDLMFLMFTLGKVDPRMRKFL